MNGWWWYGLPLSGFKPFKKVALIGFRRSESTAKKLHGSFSVHCEKVFCSESKYLGRAIPVNSFSNLVTSVYIPWTAICKGNKPSYMGLSSRDDPLSQPVIVNDAFPVAKPLSGNQELPLWPLQNHRIMLNRPDSIAAIFPSVSCFFSDTFPLEKYGK